MTGYLGEHVGRTVFGVGGPPVWYASAPCQGAEGRGPLTPLWGWGIVGPTDPPTKEKPMALRLLGLAAAAVLASAPVSAERIGPVDTENSIRTVPIPPWGAK